MKIVTDKDIEGIKKRFRCGACDGAKCEHTLGCQALTELLSLATEVEIPDSLPNDYDECSYEYAYTDGFNDCRQSILRALGGEV